MGWTGSVAEGLDLLELPLEPLPEAAGLSKEYSQMELAPQEYKLCTCELKTLHFVKPTRDEIDSPWSTVPESKESLASS